MVGTMTDVEGGCESQESGEQECDEHLLGGGRALMKSSVAGYLSIFKS